MPQGRIHLRASPERSVTSRVGGDFTDSDVTCW